MLILSSLKVLISSMKSVLVTEDSEEISLRKPQMSVSKLNVSTIKQMPAVLGEVDIIKSIQLLPGVTNNGEGSSGFNVRGGSVDQNLVLLDETIIYNTSHLLGFSLFLILMRSKTSNSIKGIFLLVLEEGPHRCWM